MQFVLAQIVSEGVSASTFVDNAEYRRELFELLRADCVDMESAAFMHVCASNGKRCLVVWLCCRRTVHEYLTITLVFPFCKV